MTEIFRKIYVKDRLPKKDCKIICRYKKHPTPYEIDYTYAERHDLLESVEWYLEPVNIPEKDKLKLAAKSINASATVNEQKRWFEGALFAIGKILGT